ncbi:MAG TPA: hypothetical protein VGX96_14730 [Candidatus Elarobacter sp.]|jgi:hypothetical protein|nr:hypothetical protein [Candidatus Elarobacter sp.]
MNETKNRALYAFCWCFGVAFAGIFLTTFFYVMAKGTPAGNEGLRFVSFFVFGLVPIGAYAWFVHRELQTRSAFVSETAVDAVYYLGFLVTLTTLLASVVAYALVGKSNEGSNFTFIGISFGVSLSATGIALLARVILVQLREDLVAAPEPENMLRDRTYELDEAYGRLSAVMDDAAARFGQNVEQVNSVLGERLAEAIHDARARLREAVDAASSELSQSQSSMGEATAKSAETMSANNAALFKQMSDVIEQARSSLQDFVKAASLEAPSSALAAAIADVAAAIAKGRKQVTGAFQSMEALEGRTAAATSSVEALDTHVRRASESAAAMSEALARASAGTAALDADPVRVSMAQLRESVERLNAATARAEQRYAAASDEAVGSIASKAKDLTTATEMLSDAFVAMAEELGQTAGVMAGRVR